MSELEELKKRVDELENWFWRHQHLQNGGLDVTYEPFVDDSDKEAAPKESISPVIGKDEVNKFRSPYAQGDDSSV